MANNDAPNIRKNKGTIAVIKELVFLGFLILVSVIGLMWFLRPKTSEVEKRKLTKFPTLTLKGVWDGSFFFHEAKAEGELPGGVNTWYADTYPLRELLIQGDQAVKSLYGKQGEQLRASVVTDCRFDQLMLAGALARDLTQKRCHLRFAADRCKNCRQRLDE
jgi:hypothetical protein